MKARLSTVSEPTIHAQTVTFLLLHWGFKTNRRLPEFHGFLDYMCIPSNPPSFPGSLQVFHQIDLPVSQLEHQVISQEIPTVAVDNSRHGKIFIISSFSCVVLKVTRQTTFGMFKVISDQNIVKFSPFSVNALIICFSLHVMFTKSLLNTCDSCSIY